MHTILNRACDDRAVQAEVPFDVQPAFGTSTCELDQTVPMGQVQGQMNVCIGERCLQNLYIKFARVVYSINKLQACNRLTGVTLKRSTTPPSCVLNLSEQLLEDDHHETSRISQTITIA